jgi:hypothetical protein
MNDKIQVIEKIAGILKDCKFAVLATEGDGVVVGSPENSTV